MLKIIQTCEMCGQERLLGNEDKQEVGGWRDLSVGDLKVTICSLCIKAIVEYAMERSRLRREKLIDGPIYLTFTEFTDVEET